MIPSISIITVCKNALDDLCDTKVSIEEQSSEDFEWIIIDGDSTDGTKDLLNRIRSSIIHAYSEPDEGIYDAMNKGLRKAIGHRIWFMNAGDTFYSQNSLAKVAAAHDSIDICFGDAMVIGNQDRSWGKRSAITPHKLPEKLSFSQFKFGMVVSHQSFVPKREIVPPFNTDTFRLSSDLDWMLNILKCHPTTTNLGILSKTQRYGATLKNWKKSQFERFQIMVKHFGFLPTVFNHTYIVIRRIRHGISKRFWR